MTDWKDSTKAGTGQSQTGSEAGRHEKPTFTSGGSRIPSHVMEGEDFTIEIEVSPEDANTNKEPIDVEVSYAGKSKVVTMGAYGEVAELSYTMGSDDIKGSLEARVVSTGEKYDLLGRTFPIESVSKPQGGPNRAVFSGKDKLKYERGSTPSASNPDKDMWYFVIEAEWATEPKDSIPRDGATKVGVRYELVESFGEKHKSYHTTFKIGGGVNQRLTAEPAGDFVGGKVVETVLRPGMRTPSGLKLGENTVFPTVSDREFRNLSRTIEVRNETTGGEDDVQREDPEIELTDLKVVGEGFIEGDNASVLAEFENRGGPGSEEFKVIRDGHGKNGLEVEVGKGSKSTKTITVQGLKEGSTTVSVGGKSVTINTEGTNVEKDPGAEKSPTIGINSLSADKNKVTVGEEVTLEVNAGNTGGSGSVDYPIYTNGTKGGSIGIELDRMENGDFTKPMRFSTPGEYRIEVGDEAVNITVTEETSGGGGSGKEEEEDDFSVDSGSATIGEDDGPEVVPHRGGDDGEEKENDRPRRDRREREEGGKGAKAAVVALAAVGGLAAWARSRNNE